MTIEIGGIMAFVATAMGVAAKIFSAVQEFAKAAKPLVQAAEALAQDGKIDKADRKIIVEKAVAILVSSGKVSIPWYVKPFLGFIIDSIAKKLPDFEIKKLAVAVTNDAAKLVDAGIA